MRNLTKLSLLLFSPLSFLAGIFPQTSQAVALPYHEDAAVSSLLSPTLPTPKTEESEKRNFGLLASSAGNSFRWLLSRETPLETILAQPGSYSNSTPNLIDLRGQMPPITRQGNIGSCTAHALAAALEHDQIQQGRSSSTHYPSLLQLYYSEREIRGSINEDVGAQLADGIRVLYETGTCSEALWPYSDDTLLYKVKPSDACFAEAARNRDQQGIAHSRVAPNIESIKHVHNRGYSVLLGIQVYKDFDSSEFAQSALAKLPAPDETSTGGHALLSVGYDDREFLTTSWGETRANPHYRHLIVRNSWGNAWGDKGYFYLPYDYVNPSRVYEVWVVRKTT